MDASPANEQRPVLQKFSRTALLVTVPALNAAAVHHQQRAVSILISPSLINRNFVVERAP